MKASAAMNDQKLYKPKAGKFKRKSPLGKKKLTLPISFFQPSQRSYSPRDLS
jgi:hypothetical protein